MDRVHTHASVDEPCTFVAIPPEPEPVLEARRRMVTGLRAHDLDTAVVMDAEIVLGELIANAIEHGGPNEDGVVEVGWCVVDGLLRISVVDGGTAIDLRPVALDPDSARGRGLHLVDTICDRWEADLHPGTRVTAEMRI